MTTRQMHWDEKVWEDPKEFKPERWLGEEKKRSLKHFAPFGGGSRICLGMTLAYAEIYVGLGNIFRKFEMELYNTTLEDVAIHRDGFAPVGYPGSNGLRVKVKAIH
jgi:cytochrome P450